MSNDKLTCPSCKSKKVAISTEAMYMANTDDIYCYSIKSYDPRAATTCLKCGWSGLRNELVITSTEE